MWPRTFWIARLDRNNFALLLYHIVAIRTKPFWHTFFTTCCTTCHFSFKQFVGLAEASQASQEQASQGFGVSLNGPTPKGVPSDGFEGYPCSDAQAHQSKANEGAGLSEEALSKGTEWRRPLPALPMGASFLASDPSHWHAMSQRQCLGISGISPCTGNSNR